VEQATATQRSDTGHGTSQQSNRQRTTHNHNHPKHNRNRSKGSSTATRERKCKGRVQSGGFKAAGRVVCNRKDEEGEQQLLAS
jgi:hypothetical protein